ncbi:unnamed protein product [Scytosiphon promiscuus]
MKFPALRRAALLAAPVLLLSLQDVARAADAVVDDGVLVLTGDTIEQAIKDNSHLVVEFYAPWCGHCKKLAPALSEAAKKIKEVDEKIVFAKMDCTADGNKEFKDKMGIKGFPSFRMFEGTLESAKEHRPPRVMPQLMQYFKAIKVRSSDSSRGRSAYLKPEKCFSPSGSAVTVLSKDNFEDFISADFAVVEFYAPWCGHCKKLFPEYTKASIELKGIDESIKLGKIDMDDASNKAVGGKFGVRGYPTLKIFRKGVASDYSGPRDATGIVEFLKTEKAKSPGAELADADDDDDDSFDDDDDDDDDDDAPRDDKDAAPAGEEAAEARVEL